ncbi:MAG TPA: 8-oxo-dGTP diphosphatase MutT [Gammaproteobacteria bacterium]
MKADVRPRLHVLVGLLTNARGEVLVNRRRPGTHMAGYWEFPGGKSLPGEDRLAALRRELHEELGVEVLEAEPVLELAHEYPERSVVLDVWRVERFGGEPHAREGQEIRWVPVAELETIGLLPADRPIVDLLLGG